MNWRGERGAGLAPSQETKPLILHNRHTKFPMSNFMLPPPPVILPHFTSILTSSRFRPEPDGSKNAQEAPGFKNRQTNQIHKKHCAEMHAIAFTGSHKKNGMSRIVVKTEQAENTNRTGLGVVLWAELLCSAGVHIAPETEMRLQHSPRPLFCTRLRAWAGLQKPQQA